MARLVNIAGEVFGFWRVMDRAPQHNTRTAANWWCLCVCGAYRAVPGAALRSGQSISCGCMRTYSHVKIEHDDPKLYSARYVIYRDTAARRGLVFALTLAEFIEVAKLDCHYCGARPALPIRKERKYGQSLLMNGIDRVVNSVGYFRNNVVACCTTCNAMKLTQNLEDFLARIHRIAQRHPA